jgi:uncharacterized protein (DUF885 family)
MYSAEPLPHFVDEYLAYLYEVHPTSATFDGVHLHDDLLEDWGRQAIDAQSRDLGGFARRLAAIDPAHLTDTERLERPALDANIRARLLDLDDIRSWERNPQHYADCLATSLAGQALFNYAPLAERARRVLSKLRQVPRFIQSARDNIKDPPGNYVKVGLESMRGTLRFIDDDLPRAFGDLSDLHLLGDLADASTEAAAAISSYVEYLERDVAPRAKGSFRLGRDRFEQKLRLDEGITLTADRLLAIATRELQATQDEFRRVASRVNGGDPMAAWAKTKDDHPSPGELIPVAQQQLADLVDFINRQRIVTIPNGAPVEVAPTPRFYRWTFASMWTPGPFEARPLRAFYYITDVEPSWPAERQREHLRDFNYGALWSISIHEVFPGHFLHYQHLRQIDAKLRKSILFSSTAFVEGWAHYCEQMMIEEGFRKNDHAVRLGQLAEALIRLCRVIVGIRLHCEDMSVEQGVRFFRDEAFLEEASARREAERGTFDPSYVLYSAGKLMILKLRDDYKAHAGARYSLRGFHDAVLAQGNAPFWAHRRLLLGDAPDASLD